MQVALLGDFCSNGGRKQRGSLWMRRHAFFLDEFEGEHHSELIYSHLVSVLETLCHQEP